MSEELSGKIESEMDAAFEAQIECSVSDIMQIIKDEFDGLGTEILNLLESRGHELNRLDQDDIRTIISRKVK